MNAVKCAVGLALVWIQKLVRSLALGIREL